MERSVEQEHGEIARAELRIPAGWEESLIFQLQEESWGAALAERSFPAGCLDDEEPPPAVATVIVLFDPGREPDLIERLQTLAAAYGWPRGCWSLRLERRPRRDWEAAWRDRWKPFRCGRLVVHADFHQGANLRLRPGDVRLELASGSAFGTGGHSSTRAALRAIQAWAAAGRMAALLDVGTGSGILAVAAAVLGAGRVAGMDPDPYGPPQARATAARNGVGGRCHFWRGTLESATGRWPAITANLQSDLLVRYAALLAKLLDRQGFIFVGGILDRRSEEVFRALTGAGLRLLRRQLSGRWVTAQLQH